MAVQDNLARKLTVIPASTPEVVKLRVAAYCRVSTDSKDQLQALDISDLCRLFIKGEYNELIRLVRKGGYIIHTVSDKKKLHDIIQSIIDSPDFSICEIVELAISHKLIKRTETYSNISARNANFLEQLKADELYQK